MQINETHVNENGSIIRTYGGVVYGSKVLLFTEMMTGNKHLWEVSIHDLRDYEDEDE